MLFTSLQFLIFFPIVATGYFLLSHRWRWAWLLAASYYFYMSWSASYALLLLASTIVAYVTGLGLGHSQSIPARKGWVAFGVGVNLVFLFVFKYYGFFAAQLDHLSASTGLGLTLPKWDFLLPLGISFYTFQGLSYIVDVYRGELAPERHFGLFALYKSYFPQLIAGPIERGAHFIPQLRKLLHPEGAAAVAFDHDRVVSGLRLCLLGFFKKLALADNLALFVDPVYSHPAFFSGCSAVLATVAFALQIFFDFSAYTDIARGTSRLLGFDLIENFRRPYFARDIQDFWRRWHISLSSWFRDYLYIPLGGNRVSRPRWFFNLWVVFLLCGLWHGANWTFVVWGSLHGLYYCLTYVLAPFARRLEERTFLRHWPRFNQAVMILLTFSLVCAAWVFFRARTLADAGQVWQAIAVAPGEIWRGFPILLQHGPGKSYFGFLGLSWVCYSQPQISLLGIYTFSLAIIYWMVAFAFRDDKDGRVFQHWPRPWRWAVYYGAIAVILLLGRLGANQFIYFQF